MEYLLVKKQQHFTNQSFDAKVEVIAVQNILTSVTQGFISIGEETGLEIGFVDFFEVNTVTQMVNYQTITSIFYDVVSLDDDNPVTFFLRHIERQNVARISSETGTFADSCFRDR